MIASIELGLYNISREELRLSRLKPEFDRMNIHVVLVRRPQHINDAVFAAYVTRFVKNVQMKHISYIVTRC